MQHTNDPYQPDFEQLLRYVFREMSEEEESLMEDYLDANQDDADIVEGILQFCTDEGIRDRKAYEAAMAKIKKGPTEADIEQQQTPFVKPSRPTLVPSYWKWLAATSALLFLIAIYWIYRFAMQNDALQEEIKAIKTINEQSKVNLDICNAEIIRLDSIIAEHKNKNQVPKPKQPVFVLNDQESYNLLTTIMAKEPRPAGAANYLASKSYDSLAIFLREKKNLDLQEKYIIGTLCLLKKGIGSPEEAVNYLEPLQDSDLERRDYNKLMLIAYLSNGQYTKARNWIKSKEIQKSEWPRGAAAILE